MERLVVIFSLFMLAEIGGVFIALAFAWGFSWTASVLTTTISWVP